MNNRFLTATIIVVVVAWIGLVVTQIFKQEDTSATTGKSQQQTAQPQTSGSETARSMDVLLQTDTSTWKAGQQYTVNLDFKQAVDPVPSVFTLELLFDPKLLNVTSAENGNLWTGSNLLQNDINNREGKLILTIGQGFDAQTTGKTTIATFNFSVKQSTDQTTAINLGPNSSIAKDGVETKLKAKPLVISF